MSRSSDLKTKSPIKVVVLVLENHQGDLLITQRQKHQHLAGYWEFPGGKVENGETNLSALKRESLEELNHAITSALQILKIQHHYPSVSVELIVYHEVINQSSMQLIKALENQPMKWVKKSELMHYKLPEANSAILKHFKINPCS